MTGISEDKSPTCEPPPTGGPIDYVDKAAFCRWVERQEHKYEWKEGRVVMTMNVSRRHSRIVMNFVRVFCDILDIDDGSFPVRPAEITGREATIDLTDRAIVLPMYEIYRGIPDP